MVHKSPFSLPVPGTLSAPSLYSHRGASPVTGYLCNAPLPASAASAFPAEGLHAVAGGAQQRGPHYIPAPHVCRRVHRPSTHPSSFACSTFEKVLTAILFILSSWKLTQQRKSISSHKNHLPHLVGHPHREVGPTARVHVCLWGKHVIHLYQPTVH